MTPKETYSLPFELLHHIFKKIRREHLFRHYYACLKPANPSLKKLKDKGRSHRCFIIGNGPSLKLMDLSYLRNEITFGVNSIFLHYDRMGFYPTYYVVEDNFVAEDRAKEINQMYGPIKIFPKLLSYCLYQDDKTIYSNVIYDYSNYPQFPHFSTNASKYMWVGGTVTYLCLQLAYFLGCNPVYLIGIDHNYIIPGDAKKQHNEITSLSNDPNHFHPDYFGTGYRWHDPNLPRMEKAYERAKECFEKDDRKIYNATVGGKLEIFERVNYDSIWK